MKYRVLPPLRPLALAIGLMICHSIAFAQNVKDDVVVYSYVKLPLNPLTVTPKHYQASIYATYEAENQKLKAAYEAELAQAESEYNEAMAAYPAIVKAAKDKYEADLAEWNEKSLAEKVVEKQILNENNKPVEYIPAPPYKRYVTAPKLQTSYDYPVIADTYLRLGGFENRPENAVLIQVTLYGFDYTQPRQLTVQKNITSIANGQSTTRSVTYYYIEFSYRQPMSVLVLNPDGTELFNLTPQELNTYQIYKSPETEKTQDANNELLVKTREEQLFQDNLIFINDLINDKIGYQSTERSATLYYVKAKDDTYKDLLIAYNEASSGLKLLIDNNESANTKINNAVTAWQAAMLESNPSDKKARIDKDVTIAICFNLLECYFALGNTNAADAIFNQLNGMSLSYGERQRKDDMESAFNDLKKRIEINKN